MKIDCRRGLFGSRIEIRSSGQVENDQNRAAEPLEYLPGPKTPINKESPKNNFNNYNRLTVSTNT